MAGQEVLQWIKKKTSKNFEEKNLNSLAAGISGKEWREKKENKPQTNLITIYVYNKKQLAQAQSMGGYFCSAYKKKTRSWNYKLRSPPARFMTLLIIILSLPLLLCCLSFSLELLHLVESREKGAKEECTTRKVWHFSAANNNKINYRQHSAGLQGSKEKRQRSHF